MTPDNYAKPGGRAHITSAEVFPFVTDDPISRRAALSAAAACTRAGGTIAVWSYVWEREWEGRAVRVIGAFE
jgi:hypothetical protein